jgi:hypothetical protein
MATNVSKKTLKMKVAGSSKMLVMINQAEYCHMQEESHLQSLLGEPEFSDTNTASHTAAEEKTNLLSNSNSKARILYDCHFQKCFA